MEDTNKARKMEDLPTNAVNYIKTLERLLGLKIEMISVGPERSEVIRL